MKLLKELVKGLGVPCSSKVNGAEQGYMRELRVQSDGHSIRIFHACDRRRTATLLISGRRLEQETPCRDYERMADTVHDEYSLTLRREGQLDSGRGG